MRLFAIYAILLLLKGIEPKISLEKFTVLHTDEYLSNLKVLLIRILRDVRIQNCFAIITDEIHSGLYDKEFFFTTAHQVTPFYIIKIGDLEDLLAPNYKTTQVLKQIKTYDCKLHFVTLINGLQTKRFLQFAVKFDVLNTRNNFVMLHDDRIFEADMLYIWSAMISTVFLQRHSTKSYSLATIAYPSILTGTIVLKKLGKWIPGSRIRGKIFFPDKTTNLKGAIMHVAIFEHVPMVQWNVETHSYQGVEIQIVDSLSNILNFQPAYYKSQNSEIERWGRPLINGSYTGIIGEMINHLARLGIGDLHLFQTYYEVIDLSHPHSFECLTFLTPESTRDNSWKTLIQPFSGGMWLGVLLSLFLVGTIFYIISFLNAVLMRSETALYSTGFFTILRKKSLTNKVSPSLFRDVRFLTYLNEYREKRHLRRDLFDDYQNCILLTYSMLLYVSLPRMPMNWPLRVLTGWYWIYCILLTVTYRASFTAILANPTARVTIDTLDDLFASRIRPIAWGIENKLFFDESFDEIAQKLGDSMELIENTDQVTIRIAKGMGAYYDNEYFLRHLRVQDNKQRVGTEVLHIMRDCVVNMPVGLGLEKHSPLKNVIDKNLQHLIEGGLLSKWLKDAIVHLPSEEEMPQEALMNLAKFWSSFVVLAFGYFLGICSFVSEKLHFKYIVSQHPLYNVYNPNLYYNFKKRFPNG